MGRGGRGREGRGEGGKGEGRERGREEALEPPSKKSGYGAGNNGPISYRFRDRQQFQSKIAKRKFHPLYFASPLNG